MSKSKLLDSKQKIINYVQKRRDRIGEERDLITRFAEVRKLEEQAKIARRAYEQRCEATRPEFNAAWDRVSMDAKKYLNALVAGTPVTVDTDADEMRDRLVKPTLGVVE